MMKYLLRKVKQVRVYSRKVSSMCGHRLRIQIDRVLLEKGETSEGVLKKVTLMCEEADSDILDIAIDHTHRIGN